MKVIILDKRIEVFCFTTVHIKAIKKKIPSPLQPAQIRHHENNECNKCIECMNILSSQLKLCTLSKNSSRRHSEIFLFFYFLPQKGFDISCKLSLWRQFAWNVKACFLWKLRKISPVCCLLNLPTEWWKLISFVLFYWNIHDVIRLHLGRVSFVPHTTMNNTDQLTPGWESKRMVIVFC